MDFIRGESYRYQILSFLGEGGSGQVYKALRFSLGGRKREFVAIKFLKTKKCVQEIVTEYEVLQSLRSTYVVKVLGVERLGGKVALVMEYIEGLNLTKVLRLSLNPQIKAYILNELKAAFENLKACEVFHGDVSPSNILIDIHGNLRLIDFGNHFADNRFKYATPAFAPEGSCRDISSDMQSVDKIAQYYDLREATFEPETTKKSVGRLVEDLLKLHTKLINDERSQRGIFWPLVVHLAVFLILLPIEARPPLFKLPKKANVMTLKIVSKSWKRVRVNGVDFGFTPVVAKIHSKDLRIEWKDVFRSGVIRKEVTEEETLLKDKDFDTTNAL